VKKKAEGRRQNAEMPRAGDLVCIAVFALALVISVCGCVGTVRPAPVTRAMASWDGTNQNSGFLCWTNGGAIITEQARERYDGLRMTYGMLESPVVRAGDGIQSGPDFATWFIDSQRLAYFSKWTRWKREGRPAK
jgi:hypothetical protein